MRTVTAPLVIVLSLAATGPARPAEPNGRPARECWLKTPSVSIMTGFIYEPLKPYTIQQWQENLGSQFDADRWVGDFKSLGANHLVFYDKWIDGLVFHDTQTTNFKTKRDFLRELAAACQRGGLPLVLYFNAVSDGNPEFDDWSLLDRAGKPIVFGAAWPTRYQTLHSPFRAKCLQQVREVLSNYGPIDGIWHDIFEERLYTNSTWTAQGYQAMFGEPFEKASGSRLAEFNARTLAGYLDEVEAIRREQHQDRCVFTSNGSGGLFFSGGVWKELVGSRLQYLFQEGHSSQANEQLARMAWALPKPLDINLLLNSTWFTPREDSPPRSHVTAEQAIAATAIAVCQGAGVNLALTPGHAGTFGEDLQRAQAVGAWFQQLRPWLQGAQPSADVGVVYGPGAPAVNDALARAGVFSRWLAPGQPLPDVRAIVVLPHSPVDQRLRDYVQAGGTLVTFGNPGAAADLFGVRVQGQAAFAKTLSGASVKVDSEYNDQFAAAHLLDGRPDTAWASGGTPMPHWAEITLPEPVEIQTVEVVSREGPYLVTDVDIELPAADGWRIVKSIRDATQRIITAPLDAPAKTDRLRVKILRERYEGQDRQYADVASIRVLDRTGRSRAGGAVQPVQLVGASAEFGSAFGEAFALPPSAVAVEPTTAEVLARFDNHDRSPAALRNRVGQGCAVLVTATTVSGDDAALWAGLRQLVLGEPTFRVSTAHARRFRFLLARVGQAHVLHVIDAAVPGPGAKYEPQPVEISLATQRLGGPLAAKSAVGEQPLSVSTQGGRIVFTVRPDPVASIVLTASTSSP